MEYLYAWTFSMVSSIHQSACYLVAHIMQFSFKYLWILEPNQYGSPSCAITGITQNYPVRDSSNWHMAVLVLVADV